MTLDDYFHIGETRTLGAHTFGAGEIKAFAARFDPQPFHMDEAAAARSVLGGLCASGWHTVSMWMRYNLLAIAADPTEWTGPGEKPEIGPSPGFENLKWLKPVYAGDTITYTRTNLAHRALASRPGWRILTMHCEGHDQAGAKIVEFDSAVLFKAG